jgi:hypothetical protein
MAGCDRWRAIRIFPAGCLSALEALFHGTTQAAAATAAAGVERKVTPNRLNAFIRPIA